MRGAAAVAPAVSAVSAVSAVYSPLLTASWPRPRRAPAWGWPCSRCPPRWSARAIHHSDAPSLACRGFAPPETIWIWNNMQRWTIRLGSLAHTPDTATWQRGTCLPWTRGYNDAQDLGGSQIVCEGNTEYRIIFSKPPWRNASCIDRAWPQCKNG